MFTKWINNVILFYWEFIPSLLCSCKLSFTMPLQSDYVALYLFHSRWKNINLRGDLERFLVFSLSFLHSSTFTAPLKIHFREIWGKSSFIGSFIQSFTSKQAVKVDMPVFLYFRVFVTYESWFPQCAFWEHSSEGLWD